MTTDVDNRSVRIFDRRLHAHFPFPRGAQVKALQTEMGRTRTGGPPDYWGLWNLADEPHASNGQKGVGRTVKRHGRWAVSKAMWPEERFPVYANGFAYVLSQRAVDCVTSKLAAHPYVSMEDVATAVLVRSCGFNLTSSRQRRRLPNPAYRKDRLPQREQEQKEGGKGTKEHVAQFTGEEMRGAGLVLHILPWLGPGKGNAQKQEAGWVIQHKYFENCLPALPKSAGGVCSDNRLFNDTEGQTCRNWVEGKQFGECDRTWRWRNLSNAAVVSRNCPMTCGRCGTEPFCYTAMTSPAFRQNKATCEQMSSAAAGVHRCPQWENNRRI